MELGLSDAPPPRSSILEPLRSTSCDTSLSARAHPASTQGAGQELEGRSQAEERGRNHYFTNDAEKSGQRYHHGLS